MSLTKGFIVSFILLTLGLAMACAGGVVIEPVKTKTLVFQADPEINYGQLLPVDIIYVSYLNQLRDLTSIGPTRWFNSDKRQTWASKHSVGLVGGQKVAVTLNPNMVAKSPFIVVFATFKGVTDPAPQQVVLDSQAGEYEYISVRPHSLEPANAFLRE